MLTLNDGRSELWQWDTGRKLTVDADCTQVHFSNKFFGRSVDVDVVDGVAEIPDVLLQADKELLVWAFVGTAENGYTKISKAFKVNKRNKPADYVFTPTEQTTLDEIMKRLDRIEKSQDPDAIKNAVDEYLANNPIQVEEKDPTVPDWAKQPTKPKYTADEVGAVATVNGKTPDENGNVEIEIPEGGGTVTDEQIAEAVDKYLDENEIDTDVVYVLAEGETLNDAPESADIVIDPTGTPGGGGGGGVTPTFSIGTVETLAPGSDATASISGTAANPVLNLGIPQGLPGEGGNSGDTWELLNTITVSDDATTNVTFTEDSNGNPLDLKKFYLRVSGIAGASTYPVLRLNGLNWQQQFGGGTPSGSNVMKIPVLFEIMSDGCYCCEWHNPVQKEIRFDGDRTGAGGIQSHIDSVNSIFWMWGSNAPITNGAIFTLYGVRA